MGLLKLAATAIASVLGYKYVLAPYLAKRSIKVVGKPSPLVANMKSAVLNIAARLKGAKINSDVISGEHNGAPAVLVKVLDKDPGFVARMLPESVNGIAVVVID